MQTNYGIIDLNMLNASQMAKPKTETEIENMGVDSFSNEFSESEDMLDDIRSVVEKVQETIDKDEENENDPENFIQHGWTLKIPSFENDEMYNSSKVNDNEGKKV